MHNPTWWKEAVIYQIYPRSFKDSNGDGIGDLRGIIEKLDYLADLGVDILWLSPIFQSPNDDNGYDVSDYTAIMSEFGTMADFDEMLEKAHARGLKILLDLVVNHSSDEHRWFREARKSPDNPYRDFYFWEKEKPNNWGSFFSPSAWEYDEQAQAYYLHLFSKKQPDLNWETPALREAVYNDMRFWLDKGVDGFRMDVIPFISKHLDWPEPAGKEGQLHVKMWSRGPRLHEFLREMNEEVLSKYDITSVGEGIGVSTENVADFVHPDRKELDMLYHFDHAIIDHGPGGKYDPVELDYARFQQIFKDWDAKVEEGSWINIFLDNHDFPRLVSRFGNDKEYREESAGLFAILLLTMRGTPCIYQGTEIGMTNVAYPTLEDYDDLEIKNVVAQTKKNGGDLDKLLQAVHRQARDNARTPMQWTNEENAGFTTGEPWLKVNENYRKINVDAARKDADSVWYFYKNLLEYRKENKTFVYGKTEFFDTGNSRLFAYRRYDIEGDFIILLNMSDEVLDVPTEIVNEDYERIFSNYRYRPELTDEKLQPWEGRIYSHYMAEIMSIIGNRQSVEKKKPKKKKKRNYRRRK